MSAAKGNRPEKWASSHMNMKLPPDQLDTRKGRDNVMNLVKTLFDNGGYHIQFNVLDTEKLRDAQKHPENYRDLVVRVAGFSAFFCQLNKGVQECVSPDSALSSVSSIRVYRTRSSNARYRAVNSTMLKWNQVRHNPALCLTIFLIINYSSVRL
jgi:hypothetical protein